MGTVNYRGLPKRSKVQKDKNMHHQKLTNCISRNRSLQNQINMPLQNDMILRNEGFTLKIIDRTPLFS